MHTHCSWIARCSVPFILGVVAMATAQTVTPGSMADLTRKHTLTAKDDAAIEAFVDRYAGDLSSDDDAARIAARQKLVADLKGLSGQRATPLFREAYAAALTPRLRTAMQDGSIPTGIAAAQVAGVLGTDSAVAVLTDHLTADREQRDAIRLWAAASLRPLINEPNVTSSKLLRAIAAVGRAGAGEPSWPALRQQLETLSTAVSNSRPLDAGQEDLAAQALKQQSGVLGAAIERFQGGDLDMLMAIEPGLLQIQQEFLDEDDSNALNQLALSMVPVLTGLYDAVLTQWPGLEGDSARLAGRSLDRAEVLVVLMNNYVTQANDAASPDYQGAISAGNRDAVEAGKRRWGVLGTRAPYAG
ncbi:MAG: hypothetical protein QF733_09395 [Phycisphaerales bacterium]|nr:hypothetical protein [Phycisphaerales bacterium]